MKKQCPDHTSDHPVKQNAILISGAGCAIVAVTQHGGAVYDMSLLIEHFHEHEGMCEHDEEGEETTTAVEWIQYNVLRGLDYVSWEVEELMPIIMDEEFQVYPYVDEDNDDDE